MEVDKKIKLLRIIETNNECLCARYVNQNQFIAGGFLNGSINLYNTSSNNFEKTLADDDTAYVDNCTTFIALNNKFPNILTVTYSGGLIKLWNITNSTCLKTIKENRQIYGVVFHPKKSKYFTYGDDGNIFLYDVETNKYEYAYMKSDRNVCDGHSSKIFSLVFNPDNANEFVSGGWDSSVFFWDVRCQFATRFLSDVFIGGDGITINKKGTELVTCEWKRNDPIKLWDYKHGKLIDVIKPDMHRSQLYCCQYLDKNNIAVGGSDNHMFRVINLESRSTISFIKNLDGGVYTIDKRKGKRSSNPPADVDPLVDTSELPIILFASGRCLYEVHYN